MISLKLLFLVTNLALLRLVLADISGQTGTNPVEKPVTGINKSKEVPIDLQASSAIALEHINSLDYAPGGTLSSTHDQPELVAPKKPSAKRRSGRAAQHKSVIGNVTSLFVNLLGQLEKTDFKRLINDALAMAIPEKGTTRRSGADGISANSSQPKSRSGLLSAETDNLLSVTKQLVKLARSQVMRSEFGSPMSSWLTPMVPSMIAAASHAIHDSHADFTGASLKSDWFWVVAPAVIVVGAGVIVLPLIAAWLVSHMMNQNTFTVSAGRRRRKRDLLSQGLHQFGSSSSMHSDLFKLIDIHRVLDHELEPQLLVNKLAQLQSFLSSYHPKTEFMSSPTQYDAKSRSKSEKF